MYTDHPEVMGHVGFDHTAREYELVKLAQTNRSEEIFRMVNFIVRIPDKAGLDYKSWREAFSNRDFSVYERIVP
jgi:hypothetical protein